MAAHRTLCSDMLRAEDGGISVEYVLWTPAILALLLLVADTSAAFLAQGAMWHAAGDISRALATGRVALAEAEQFLAESAGYALEVRLQGELISVQLSRPFEGIGTGMMLSPLGEMQVTIIQRLEPGIEL